MEAKDFKPGISFERKGNYFRYIESEIKGNPCMILIERDSYFEYFANVELVEKGIVSIYRISEFGDKTIHESATISEFRLIKLN